MARYFLETSALIKRYKREAGTDFINTLFLPSNKLHYLNLSILEIRKVFQRLRYSPLQQEKQIDDIQLKELESRFAADLLLMDRIVFTEEMIDRGIEILKNTWIPGVFDLAQLSSYLIAREVYSDVLFVCSDSRSKLIGVAISLVGQDKVIIPEIQ